MVRIRVDLARSERDFGVFCAARDKLIGCRYPHCEATCAAPSLRFVQQQCDKGRSILAAVKAWVYSKLTHKQGEEILADILGVKDMKLLRRCLSGETA